MGKKPIINTVTLQLIEFSTDNYITFKSFSCISFFIFFECTLCTRSHPITHAHAPLFYHELNIRSWFYRRMITYHFYPKETFIAFYNTCHKMTSHVMSWRVNFQYFSVCRLAWTLLFSLKTYTLTITVTVWEVTKSWSLSTTQVLIVIIYDM